MLCMACVAVVGGSSLLHCGHTMYRAILAMVMLASLPNVHTDYAVAPTFAHGICTCTDKVVVHIMSPISLLSGKSMTYVLLIQSTVPLLLLVLARILCQR